MKFAQSCPNVRDPKDYTVHGILQARILEWVTVPFYRDLPNPGIKPRSPALQADSLPAELLGKPYIYTLNSITKSPIVQIKNGQKIKIDIFSPKKDMKICSASLFNMEMQIKAKGYHLIPIRMIIIK